MGIEKTNERLTSELSSLTSLVSDVSAAVPLNFSFEPSAGTVSSNLDGYLDASNGKLYLKAGSSWVTFDVSVGL